jgi:F-type H+-transporting ATPase subunit gamma
MPSLKDIRKRISSVKNTQKITRALKLVSAAKLSRAQRELSRLKPYADKQQEMIRDLVAELGDAPSPLLEARLEVRKIAVILIASDRGMCGGFNSNLLKRFKSFVAERKAQGASVSAFPLGKRAIQFVEKGGYTMGKSWGEALAADLMDRLPSLTRELVAGFSAGDFDEVVIISNRFVNAITQTPATRGLLPMGAPEGEAQGPEGSLDVRIYEPGQRELLDYVLPRALETQVRRVVLESITGEHAARMNAMNSATDNASDMINSLTLDLNRARQAAITKELMEIISGAEALK